MSQISGSRLEHALAKLGDDLGCAMTLNESGELRLEFRDSVVVTVVAPKESRRAFLHASAGRLPLGDRLAILEHAMARNFFGAAHADVWLALEDEELAACMMVDVESLDGEELSQALCAVFEEALEARQLLATVRDTPSSPQIDYGFARL